MGNHGFFGFSGPSDPDTPKFTPFLSGNLWVWFKADSLVGLKDGDRIALWENSKYECSGDPSSNWNDCIQNTVSLQPMYKINQCNGLPVVRFSFNEGFQYTPLITLTRATWFVVLKRNRTDQSDMILSYDGSSSDYSFLQNNTTWTVTNGGTAAISFPGDTWTLKCAVYNGTNIPIYTNGSAHTPVAAGVKSSLQRYLGPSGQNYWLAADIAEMIVYKEALPDTERRSVENYLNEKYALW